MTNASPPDRSPKPSVSARLQKLIDRLTSESPHMPALALDLIPATIIDDEGGYETPQFDARPDFVRADDAGWERLRPWKR